MSELNIFLFVSNICVAVLVGALLPIIPFLTRKSFLFGVKVPPEAQTTDEAKKLKRNYIIVTTAGALIILVASIVQFIIAPDCTIITVLYYPFLLIAVQLGVFVPSHRKALKLKSCLNWNVTEMQFADTKASFTRGNLSSMPRFWYVISFLIVLASFVIALVKYPTLPDSIPTHWDFNVQPDAWKDKSVGTVLIMPVINLLMFIVTWFAGVLIEKTKLQIDHKEPAKSFAQHEKYRRIMGHGLGFFSVVFVFMFFISGLMPLYHDFTVPLWLTMSLGVGSGIPICVIAVRAGQSGVLLKVDITEVSDATDDELAGNSAMSDDRLWVWGMFYCNPEDPAYFVGDRFGSNIGLNYSRLPVKIGVTILTVALVVSYILMTSFFISIIR